MIKFEDQNGRLVLTLQNINDIFRSIAQCLQIPGDVPFPRKFVGTVIFHGCYETVEFEMAGTQYRIPMSHYELSEVFANGSSLGLSHTVRCEVVV